MADRRNALWKADPAGGSAHYPGCTCENDFPDQLISAADLLAYRTFDIVRGNWMLEAKRGERLVILDHYRARLEALFVMMSRLQVDLDEQLHHLQDRNLDSAAAAQPVEPEFHQVNPGVD